MDNTNIIKGAVSTAASAASITVSFLPQVEQWLRLASLFAGLVVALLTIFSMMRKHRGEN